MAVCLLGATLVLLFLPAHPHPANSAAPTATANDAPYGRSSMLNPESGRSSLPVVPRWNRGTRRVNLPPKTLELSRAEPTADTEIETTIDA